MKHISFKKLLSKLVVTAAVVTVATISASACTTIYVGGNLVKEGTPFVARTEDYGSDMNKLWFISEAGQFKKGEKYLGCPGYGEFEWTWTHDSYRFTHFTNDIYFNGTCPECGEGTAEKPCTHFSYTEFGTNEKGVSVSATETIYGNKEVTAEGADPFRQKKVDGKVGIEETDIPTIVLAEAASAREGVELLMDIYDEYGAYFASGIFICDKDETWYIENCSGTQYVAVKLNDDMIFLEPNIAVIGRVDLDDTENVLASERLIEVAKQAGTFVGDEKENIIDFRASYAPLDRVGCPRMVDGLNFLNQGYGYTEEDMLADNTRFTISNLNGQDKIVPLYTNIKADRLLDKKDVFNYYKLSSIGKPSNQEIEIFQLFKDRPVETATVGWVGVGNMSNNVFVPYYPMLMTDMYEGYQVSTDTVKKVDTKPEGFCTWTDRNGGKFVQYPENWRDSYYFAFEGLGGYIQDADKIDGVPVSAENKQLVLDKMDALQDELIQEFETMKPADTTVVGKDMAKRAHMLALEMIDHLKEQVWKNPYTDVKQNDWFYQAAAYVNENKLMRGVTDSRFAPADQMTRAMLAQILYNRAGTPDVSEDAMKAPFTDVDANSWYSKAVYWARENKIAAGYSNGAFGVADPVTREQMAVMLYQAAGKPAVADQALTFSDKDSISDYAVDAMRWAVQNNILSGKPGNTVDPKGNATRAEAAQMIMQFDLLK